MSINIEEGTEDPMRKVLALLSMIAILTLSASAFAHGGNPHIMGTVTAIDEHQIEVKTTDGKTVSATLTKDTKYTKGKEPATRADVKVGMRAVLHLEGKGEPKTVHLVDLPSEK